jgi:4a-hydroxytetrahydrobiopterin dehydratase
VPRLLSDGEISSRLKKLRGWKRDGAFITKVFEFSDFKDGIAFVDRVADVAESEEHHPDIHIRYSMITLSVQTHSEGGVTEWDFELAEAIEKMQKRDEEGVRPRKHSVRA